ncbi:unnamed protein product [Blumeria hordei]|uniref:Uncharacterized protein n=1 Tax=Blumeria hordei TaxID=2867405 RepID=A0A383URA6_BLUHO|nr:unnamed protein product [Blumeria hordei]
MRPSLSIFLSTYLGLNVASPDASVFIFQKDNPLALHDTPQLSLDQSRLVLAQRLDISQHYRLQDYNELSLSHINRFGSEQQPIFDSNWHKIPELVLVVEGVSSMISQFISDAISPINPNFTIVAGTTTSENSLLISELQAQAGKLGTSCSLENAINPSQKSCWSRDQIMIRFNLNNEKNGMSRLINAQNRIKQLSKKGEMNAAIVLFPEVSGTLKPSENAEDEDEKSARKRQHKEEPLIYTPSVVSSVKQLQSSRSKDKPMKGIPQLCHKSLDLCVSSTNNCTGHGECFKKYGDRDKGDCYTCGCKATNDTVTWAKGTKKGWKITYWGGSACHKEDISGAFWLISVFSVTAIAVVGWGIGMLFSIGAESLPGVIGAGVSSKPRSN